MEAIHKLRHTLAGFCLPLSRSADPFHNYVTPSTPSDKRERRFSTFVLMSRGDCDCLFVLTGGEDFLRASVLLYAQKNPSLWLDHPSSDCDILFEWPLCGKAEKFCAFCNREIVLSLNFVIGIRTTNRCSNRDFSDVLPLLVSISICEFHCLSLPFVITVLCNVQGWHFVQ